MMKRGVSSNGWAWAVIAVSIAGLIWMKCDGLKAGKHFPDRPLSLICPFSAGGGTDMLCRKLASEAGRRLGQSVMVNNVTGGGGAIGHVAGQLAVPDGYTVLATTFELISLPLQGLVPFTQDDFDLLMMINMDPASVAVRSDYPGNTLKEFIEQGRTGKPVRIGNSGSGSVWHLAAELLADRTGISAAHVPFSGASAAVTALIGGHIDAVTVSPAELQTYVQSGQVKILAVMSDAPLRNFPEVPTFRSQGVDLVFGTWRGLALPEGVSPEIRNVLEETFRAVVDSPELAAFAGQSGMNLCAYDSAAFRAMVEKQSIEVEAIMKKAGLAQ